MGRSEGGSGVGESDSSTSAEGARSGADIARFDALVRDVAIGLVDQHDPDRLQTTLVDTLAATGLYSGVWVGNRLNRDPTAAVGDDGLLEVLGKIAMIPEDRNGLVTSGRITVVPEPVVQSLAEDLDVEIPRVTAARVPLQSQGLACGMGVVATERDSALDGTERAALADVGRLTGHALDASVYQTLLVADGEIEVVLNLDHHSTPTGLTTLAAACDATVELERVLPRPDGAQLHVSVADPDPSLSTVTDSDAVDHGTVTNRGQDTASVKLVVPASSPLATFAASGVAVTSAVADPDSLRLTVQGGETGTEILREFQEQFPSVTCLAKRQVSSPNARHNGDGLLDRAELTTKQKTVLEVALSGGFFERPRRRTGQELAESLDISASTFHQHLRDGLRKVVRTAVEE